MPTLTPGQVYQVAVGAGWAPGTEAITATAIALAESGGRTDAVNKHNANGSRDYGLWQINHPGSTPPSFNWADPATNARIAHKLYASPGGGWTRWSTYTNGAWLKTLPKAQRASGSADMAPQAAARAATGAAAPGAGASAASGPSCRWSGPFGWCMDKPVGVLAAAGGGLMLLGGLALIAAAVLNRPAIAKGARVAASPVTAPVSAVRSAGSRRTERAAATSRASARAAAERDAGTRRRLAARQRQLGLTKSRGQVADDRATSTIIAGNRARAGRRAQREHLAREYDRAEAEGRF